MCVNAVLPTCTPKNALARSAYHARFLCGVCAAAVCSAAFRIWQTKSKQNMARRGRDRTDPWSQPHVSRYDDEDEPLDPDVVPLMNPYQGWEEQ